MVFASHEPLDGEHGVLRVGHSLAPSDLADQASAIIRDRDHRGRNPTAFLVNDDRRLITLQHGDDRVGRAEVNPYDFASHSAPPYVSARRIGGLSLPPVKS